MGKNYTFVRGAAFPYQYKYEHPAVTTDCVIFTYEDWKLKVLLVKRGGEPYKGEWALPGGFLRNDETAKEGALRELREETGLEASAVGELGVFSDPSRDPRERVITIAFYALVKPSEVEGGDDADEAAWFSIDELPQLAFDHADIINAALERLRSGAGGNSCGAWNRCGNFTCCRNHFCNHCGGGGVEHSNGTVDGYHYRCHCGYCGTGCRRRCVISELGYCCGVGRHAER